MDHRRVGAAAFAILWCFAACAVAVPIAWTEADALPILRCEPLRPIVQVDQFEQSYTLLEFRRTPKPGAATEPPFATDAEAVDFAKAWVEVHFGELQPEVQLEATSIDHSATGHPEPIDDAGRGHTIVLNQTYRGLATDRFAVVYIAGRAVVSATIELATITPVEGSQKPCVGRTTAVAAWRVEFETRADPSALARFDRDVDPRLVYAWSPAASGSSGDLSLLHPTWRLLHESPFMVDGHTGKAWYND